MRLKIIKIETVVSFMHLPVYLDDSNILGKLEGWGVNPISNIRRICYRALTLRMEQGS